MEKARNPFLFMGGNMRTAVVHVGKYLDGLDRICNHNCLFCMERMEPDGSNQILPSVDRIKASLERYRRERGSLNRLYIAGGEPTMRDDLGAIFYAAKRICNSVILSTNCDFESSQWLTQLLKASEVDEVTTSVHGSHSAIHDKITGTPDSFSRTMNSIVELCEAGIKVNVNCVICKENIDDMPRILATIQALPGIRRLVFTHFCFRGFAFYHRDLLFSALDCKEVISKTLDMANEAGFPVLFRDFPFCVDERLTDRQERVEDVDIIFLGEQSMEISRSEGAPKLEREECRKCKHGSLCPKFLLSNYGEGFQ